jgi:branched-chain amino acid transport system substrate-binding protein
MSLAAGITKAQSTETEKLITAFRGLTLMSPFGSITYRPEDHQSTMGGYVGRTKLENGKGVMGSFRYIDGASVLPSAEEVKKLRPAD